MKSSDDSGKSPARSSLQIQIRNDADVVEALHRFASTRHWSASRAVLAILREKLLDAPLPELLPAQEEENDPQEQKRHSVAWR